MHLAQELVDHIIDFLHDDPTTLLQASTVSTAWLGRTRTHLCETTTITHDKLTSLDLSYLTPLCGYIKTLRFAWPSDFIDPFTVLDRFERSRLHTLVILHCELHSLDERTMRRYFAKFPCRSITTLELHDISLFHGDPWLFLSLFPNVDNLTIAASPRWRDCDWLRDTEDEITQHTFPPRPRRSFKFSDPLSWAWGLQESGFLGTIAALAFQFQTMSLDFRGQYWEDVSPFLNSCPGSARNLFLQVIDRKRQPCIHNSTYLVSKSYSEPTN
jgi:hypothetical protein